MRQVVDKTGKKLVLLAGAFVIIVGCFAAYIPAIRGGFIWDDDDYVTANPLLTAPDGLYRIWFSTDAPSQYFPLVYTTFRVEYQLWVLNPTGYHAVNVAIHSINALLLWLVLRRLAIPWAWLAAAVFALHPVNVESVAWITERKNVLMLLFSLLSALCWVEFVFGSKSGRKAILLYAGSLVFCALALFSKATACTLPAALVLILWLKRSPVTVKRWLQIVPYIAMAIGIGLLVMWWERNHQGTGFVNFDLSPAEKTLIAGRALWFYLWKLIWPVNLAFSYPRWNIDAHSIWQYGWPVASAAAMALAWIWRERLGRGVVTAIIFFPAMLLPMLGFFPLYTFVYTFVADHYQYAACIGPIVVTAGVASIAHRKSGENARFVIAAAGLLLLTLGILTWRQCGAYRNADTLWADTLKKNPDSWLAHGEISGSLYKQGKFDEAFFHLDRQLELSAYLKEIHPMAYSDAYYCKGLIFTAKGRLGDAAEQYKKSLEVNDNSALVHYMLANILVKQGNVKEATAHYRHGLEIARAKGAENLAEGIRRQLEAVEKQKTEDSGQQ